MSNKFIEYLESRKQTTVKLLSDAKTEKDRQVCEIAIKIYDSIIEDVREGKV